VSDVRRKPLQQPALPAAADVENRRFRPGHRLHRPFQPGDRPRLAR
jgi:hypothetical protein